MFALMSLFVIASALSKVVIKLQVSGIVYHHTKVLLILLQVEEQARHVPRIATAVARVLRTGTVGYL
jgi:hypothetical protein